MIALLWLSLGILASPFKSKRRLEAENVALRHQVMVLRHQTLGNACISAVAANLFFVVTSRHVANVHRGPA